MAEEPFPRGTALPKQSPLFWAEQKDRYLRQLAIRDIEAVTGRRLVVYYANRFENAQIDAKDTAFMAELLGDVGTSPVDLLLETNGGGTDATEALVSLITNLTQDFRVIVANAAKSNGTLLALASKAIVMGATSELGPIEPLVNGIPCSVLIEPQIQQSNFPLHMFGKFALQQTRTLASTLLTNGMMHGADAQKVADTVSALASRDKFFSHGSVIDHREAAQLGLKVEYLPPDNESWQRIWLLYCMIEHDCRKGKLLKLFEGNARSTSVANVAPAPKP
jgi:ClpP class serine protease